MINLTVSFFAAAAQSCLRCDLCFCLFISAIGRTTVNKHTNSRPVVMVMAMVMAMVMVMVMAMVRVPTDGDASGDGHGW